MGPCARGRRRRGIIWRTTPPSKRYGGGRHFVSASVFARKALNHLRAAPDIFLPGTLHHSGYKPAPPSDHIPLARRSAFGPGSDKTSTDVPAHYGIAAHLCDNAATHAPRLAVQVHSFFQIPERSSLMNELHFWLSGQHPGLKTFKALQLKLDQLAASDVPAAAGHRRPLCRGI